MNLAHWLELAEREANVNPDDAIIITVLEQVRAQLYSSVDIAITHASHFIRRDVKNWKELAKRRGEIIAEYEKLAEAETVSNLKMIEDYRALVVHIANADRDEMSTDMSDEMRELFYKTIGLASSTASESLVNP